jgi:hypothetical protein
VGGLRGRVGPSLWKSGHRSTGWLQARTLGKVLHVNLQTVVDRMIFLEASVAGPTYRTYKYDHVAFSTCRAARELV